MSRRTEAAIEVLVVDDDQRFRRVVAAIVSAEHDMVVVGEAGHGDEAVAMAVALVPSVVLLDLRMPGASGIEATQAITEALPATKVIVLTVSDQEDDLYKALRAGASGYVLKDSGLGDLGSWVRTVAGGQAVLSPSMAAELVVEFTEPTFIATATEVMPRLSDRELEVLELVAEDQADSQIAERLYISRYTVKRHVANILAKLHQRTRLQAVLYAQRRNLLE